MFALLLSLSVFTLAPEPITAATYSVTSPVAREPFEEPLPTILEALDAVTDETRRMQAVTELAAAKDARLVPVFDVLLNDPDYMVERAAVRALGAISEPTATRVLSRVARSWPGLVAELAYSALGDQQTEAAAAALYRIQQDSSLNMTRRSQATETLRNRYAALHERYPSITLRNNAGLSSMVLASAELGAIDLMAIGFAGLNPALGAPLGFLSGGAVGLGAGYLIGKDKQISETRGYRLLSYQNWGLVGGFAMGLATVSDRRFHTSTQEGRFVAATTALGATAGYITALYDDKPLSMSRQLYVDVGGFASAAMAGAILTWLPASNKALPPIGFVSAAALGGLVGSRLSIPSLDLNDDDAPLLLSAPVIGAWVAPWTAYAIEPRGPGERIGGWILMGAGGGWFAGLVLADRLENSVDAVATGDAFGIYGTALGLGLPLALASDTKIPRSLRAGSMVAGGVTGFGLGAIVAKDLTLKPASHVLILGSTAFGAFQGAGFSAYNHQSKVRYEGWGLIGGTLGGAAGLVTTQYYDITPSIASAVLAGEGLGAWFSVIGGDRLHYEGRDILLAALIGTDVGLVGTVLLVGPLGVDPLRIAWAGIFGLGGAGIGATAAALATASRDHIETATLASTAAGAIAGALIAPRFSAPPVPKVETGLSILGAQPWVVRMDGSMAPGFNVMLQMN